MKAIASLLAFTFMLLVGSGTAVALPIVGEWRGTLQDTFASNGRLNFGLIDLFFTSQDADGTNIAGNLSVVCPDNPDCGSNGIVNFSGATLVGDLLTILLLAPGSSAEFTGLLSADGNTIDGHLAASDASGSVLADFHVSRVSEPTTIALLGLGLAGLAFSQRRRTT